MGILRRFLSVGLGIAAGAFAYKLLNDYNKDGHIEGDYVELPLQKDEPAEAQLPKTPDTAPNVNPVTLGTAEKPLTAEGQLDPTRIASAEDFGDWDDLGCQG